MSGPQRNPDKLNSIGIVVVGICGAVLVYVSIVALQAFYMDDTSEIQTMADYGGQDTAHRSLLAQQIENIQKYEPKAPPAAPKEGQPAAPQTYAISIDDAIKLVARDAKKDPSNLVPGIGPAIHPTVKPEPGRPRPLQDPAGAAGGTVPAGSPGAGTAGPADAGPAGAGGAIQMTPTGGQGPGGGAPPGQEGQKLQDPSGAPTQVEPPPTPPRATPAQPKGGTAPKQPAPAQPKKGNG